VRAPDPASIARVAGIARSLGDLAADVVFIGGAIAPLLQTHPPIPGVRPTSDVDAVVASAGYATYGIVEGKLRDRGFTPDLLHRGHAHRWRAPDGTPFDLVPAGAHLGGTASEWDRMAIETSVESEIEPGLIIRHASAPGFLALKWTAFRDRGASDPFSSHDLEDILALVVSRDLIVQEVADAPASIRECVRQGFHWLLESGDYDDLVAAHLGNAQPFKRVAAVLRDRARQLADA
jgi:predicted nucleotidyltransferase